MDPFLITSRQNQRVKQAVLLRQHKWRQRTRQFLVDGAREIARALAAGVESHRAFVCRERCQSTDAADAIALLTGNSTELLQVTPEVFEKLAYGDRNDGIVLVAAIPQRTLEDLRLAPGAFVVVVEGVEKPGNLGAILRTADAAGVDAVVIADGRTDLFNPNTIRASLGTVFGEHIFSAESAAVCAWLKRERLQILAACPTAKQTVFEIDMRGPVAVVLGNEAEGLSPIWSSSEMTSVRLPMCGIADSLNVSATAAIIFYEAYRQRNPDANS
jgi:TrmH family RNA methyltransferase